MRPMPVTRPSPGPARFAGPDAGFTLVEMCFATLVFGVLAATATVELKGWADAHDQSGTAAEIQAVMRETQQKAVTEGRSMCVDFSTSAQTYSVYRGSCDSSTKVILHGPIHPQGSKSRIAEPSFNGPLGISTGVTFAPRGTAWPGTVRVIRAGSGRVWTVALEGLTGRVSRA